MVRTIAEITKALRDQYTNLVDEMEANGLCTHRECMCNTAAPVIKLNAAITELEQEVGKNEKKSRNRGIPVIELIGAPPFDE